MVKQGSVEIILNLEQVFKGEVLGGEAEEGGFHFG